METFLRGALMVPDSDPSTPSSVTKGLLPIPALVVAVVTAAVHIALDLVYRPWARRTQVFDLSFANSFTNFTSVIGLSAVMVLAERGKPWADPWQAWLVVVAPVVAMMAYEFLQPLLPWGTFEVSDLVWTVIGGLAVVLLKRWVYDPMFRDHSPP
jgi:hypothetical protein